MNICFVRHAEAEPIGRSVRDFDRQLTDNGRCALTNACLGWKKLIPSFDYIISSPLIRAVQTAEIIKKIFEFPGEIILDKSVVSGKIDTICQIANSLKANNIVFCGHEPDFSNYVSDLIALNGARVNFKKSMIVKISFEGKARPSSGTIEFMLPAKLFG